VCMHLICTASRTDGLSHFRSGKGARTDTLVKVFQKAGLALLMVIVWQGPLATQSASAADLVLANPSVEDDQTATVKAALLSAHRFDALDASMSKAVLAYQAGSLSDIDLLHAFSVFDFGTSAMDFDLDAWVDAKPASAAALAARAIHSTAEGIVESTKYQIASPTSRARVISDFYSARDDFEKSLKLDPSFIVSYAGLINIEPALSPPSPYWQAFRLVVAVKFGIEVPPLSREKRLLNHANAVAPRNFIARAAYLRSIRALWGGPSARGGAGMLGVNWFIDDSTQAGLPSNQIQTLRAEVALTPLEQSPAMSAEGILTSIAPVQSLIDQRELSSLLARVAFEHANKGQADEALRFVDQAIAVRADVPRALGMRAWCLYLTKDPRSVNALQVASDAGDAWAEYVYGSLLIAGNGVPQDNNRGRRLQDDAAAQGFKGKAG
jgi:tetratricopeptide (TPR) repeat protein